MNKKEILILILWAINPLIYILGYIDLGNCAFLGAAFNGVLALFAIWWCIKLGGFR